MNLLGALLILAFGFLFVTVSSRITGEVGSTSNPISGMTVATLLLTWATKSGGLTKLFDMVVGRLLPG